MGMLIVEVGLDNGDIEAEKFEQEMWWKQYGDEIFAFETLITVGISIANRVCRCR